MSVIGNSIEVYKNMAKSATQDSINYKKRIDEAIEVLKDTNVDMDSILLCETIGYAIHILKGSDKE